MTVERWPRSSEPLHAVWFTRPHRRPQQSITHRWVIRRENTNGMLRKQHAAELTDWSSEQLEPVLNWKKCLLASVILNSFEVPTILKDTKVFHHNFSLKWLMTEFLWKASGRMFSFIRPDVLFSCRVPKAKNRPGSSQRPDTVGSSLWFTNCAFFPVLPNVLRWAAGVEYQDIILKWKLCHFKIQTSYIK